MFSSAVNTVELTQRKMHDMFTSLCFYDCWRSVNDFIIMIIVIIIIIIIMLNEMLYFCIFCSVFMYTALALFNTNWYY